MPGPASKRSSWCYSIDLISDTKFPGARVTAIYFLMIPASTVPAATVPIPLIL